MEQEQEELNLLLNKGFDVKIKFLWWSKTFQTKPMVMGRMLEMANEFIKMKVDEEALSSKNISDQLSAQYTAVIANAKRVANVIAICLSDNKLYRKLIARQVLKTFTSADLLQFTQTMIKACDYGAFIASTALMNGNRPTKATAVEK